MSSTVTPPPRPPVIPGVSVASVASRAMKLAWPGTALFLLFWLSLLVGGSRFLRDPGQFWHTSVGEKILTEGFFDTDPYTFSHAGERWIPHQWLGEVTMALVHRFGGFDALLVAAVVLVAGLYAWLGAKFVQTGLHPVFAVGVTLLAIAAAATHFHVRPHLFTMIGMAVTMHAVIEYEAGRIGWKQLVWLIPLYLVWTNTHGGMLGGLATLVLAGTGWLVFCIWDRMKGKPCPGPKLVPAAAIAFVCGLTTFVTPYGTGVLEAWLYINNGMARLPEVIAEHARLNLADPKAWPLLAMAGVYLTLLGSTLPRRPNVAWLIPVFWLAQALLRVRHGALFAPVALLAIIDFWPHTWFAKKLAAKRPDVFTPPHTRPRWVILPVAITAVICLGVSVGVQRLGWSVPLVGKGAAKLDPTLWPTELCDDLKANEPQPGEPNRIFCEYIYGGYLIHHAPGYKVFVDDRCEVFGDDWLIEFVSADRERTAEAMTEWQRQFGQFDFALTTTTERDIGYDWYFRTSPEWEMVRKTDAATFYRRR